jgi:copper homeostasis protein CutC
MEGIVNGLTELKNRIDHNEAQGLAEVRGGVSALNHIANSILVGITDEMEKTLEQEFEEGKT